MIAEYLAIDTPTLHRLKSLTANECCDAVIALLDAQPNKPDSHQTSTQAQYVDAGKLWDVLHFVLTGMSAAEPVDSPASHFLLGEAAFDDTSEDFINYLENKTLKTLLPIMQDYDFAEALQQVTMKQLRHNQLYPKGIWQGKKPQLDTILMQTYNELLTLYQQAAIAGKHIVISIL